MFEKNKCFEFSSMQSSYRVRYTFKPIDRKSFELEYYEWVDEGKIDESFTC